MFRVGDIIKGNSYNYGITDFAMQKAKIIKLLPPSGDDDNRPRMIIEILEYQDDRYIGHQYVVDNDEKDFLLISTVREYEPAPDKALDLLFT